eukprot:4640345-Alexandrium_andersonii.AAC.1
MWQAPERPAAPANLPQMVCLRQNLRAWASRAWLRGRARDSFEVEFLVACVAASGNSRNAAGFKQQGEEFIAA